MELKDKTIVITGAAGGLGQAMAVRLARCGANTALLDLNADDLQQTLSLCEQAGSASKRYAVDITDESQVEAGFRDVVDDFGALHGVVNNAGTNQDGLLVKVEDGKVVKKMSKKEWDSVSRIDMRGVFYCAREAAAHMVERGDGDEASQNRGVNLNISSISRTGNVGQTNYSAAKSGVDAMTVTWAKELGRHGIRVAAIAPGFCRTQMTEKMPEKILDRLRAQIPLQRLGDPEEVAHAAQFIFENDHFNGRLLELDGGLRL